MTMLIPEHPAPKVEDYEPMKDFKWANYAGKSYSVLNQAINGKAVIFYGLNNQIQYPQGAIAGGIMCGIFFAIPFTTFLMIPPIEMVGYITFGTLSAVGILVAIVATIILIHRHHNKLTIEEIKKLKEEFNEELQDTVVSAERSALDNLQNAKQATEWHKARKMEDPEGYAMNIGLYNQYVNIDRYLRWAKQYDQFVDAFRDVTIGV